MVSFDRRMRLAGEEAEPIMRLALTHPSDRLMWSGYCDPYGLIARTSSPEWRTQERWWIELVGAELKPLGEEGECVSCQRPAQLYADVEGMWPVCLRCRLGQLATAPGQQWRFRMVMREEVA